MAGICITSVRRGGGNCDHRDVTVDLDGETFVLDTGEGQIDSIPWDDANKELFIKLGLKRLRVLESLPLDDAPERVTNGEEATNVKSWIILAKDVTKTNIGTVYVDVPPGLNGERAPVDLTGCKEYRLILNINCIGTGPWGARVVRDTDNVVIIENANIAGAGEKELDTGWQPIPGTITKAFFLVRLQGKSVTAADDPIFRRALFLSK